MIAVIGKQQLNDVGGGGGDSENGDCLFTQISAHFWQTYNPEEAIRGPFDSHHSLAVLFKYQSSTSNPKIRFRAAIFDQ